MAYVLLVDNNDTILSKEEKLKAHREGSLHRAFSIFLFRRNDIGSLECLLQRRSTKKYHSGGLLTNACCGHPLSDDIKAEAKVRLKEELNLEAALHKAGTFIYKADVGNGLTEFEIDHVFVSYPESNEQNIDPNPEEADGVLWAKTEDIAKDLERNPHKYTAWFKTAFYIALSYDKI